MYIILLTKQSSIINNHHKSVFDSLSITIEGTSSIGILDATNTTLVRRQRVLETCFAAAQEADLSDKVGHGFAGWFLLSCCWVGFGFCFCWISVGFFVVGGFGMIMLIGDQN